MLLEAQQRVGLEMHTIESGSIFQDRTMQNKAHQESPEGAHGQTTFADETSDSASSKRDHRTRTTQEALSIAGIHRGDVRGRLCELQEKTVNHIVSECDDLEP